MTVRIVVESLGERDGVVTVRARTVLENPGKVPGQRPGPTPPRPLRRPPIGGVQPFGAFIDLEDASLFFVRRAEYSVLNVEAQLAWLPAAYPLRKECYTLVRDEEGVVSVRVPDAAMRCRLSTVSPGTGIAFR